MERMQNGQAVTLAGERLVARGSGALWWPRLRVLAVADLHLGRSERTARRGGALLPPYESADTLARLGAEIAALAPRAVVALGDSFDDAAAAEALDPRAVAALGALQAGREWIWIAGNHDPRHALPGRHLDEWAEAPLTFRHIARSGAEGGAGDETGEVSGHYHPKARVAARGRAVVRPCFLIDARRLILPAFGTFTGGLYSHAPALAALMQAGARAVLTGPSPCMVPMPR